MGNGTKRVLHVCTVQCRRVQVLKKKNKRCALLIQKWSQIFWAPNLTTWLKQNLCLFLSSKNCAQAPCYSKGFMKFGCLSLSFVIVCRCHLSSSAVCCPLSLLLFNVCCPLSFVNVCCLQLFVVVCRLLLFVICLCLSFVVVCNLLLFVRSPGRPGRPCGLGGQGCLGGQGGSRGPKGQHLLDSIGPLGWFETSDETQGLLAPQVLQQS